MTLSRKLLVRCAKIRIPVPSSGISISHTAQLGATAARGSQTRRARKVPNKGVKVDVLRYGETKVGTGGVEEGVTTALMPTVKQVRAKNFIVFTSVLLDNRKLKKGDRL